MDEEVVQSAPEAPSGETTTRVLTEEVVQSAPEAPSGETTTRVLTKDCLTVIFWNLGPMELWRCSHVCKRWARIVSLCWNRSQKESVLKWLKEEVELYYLPYQRLSYYDRVYPRPGSSFDTKLSLFWPKQPLRIQIFCPAAVDGPFVLDRLRELFSVPDLKWSVTDYGMDKSTPVTVMWEGHAVQSLLRVFLLVETQNRGTWRHQMGFFQRHGYYCGLVYVSDDIESEKVLDDFLPKNNCGKREFQYQKDFSKTPNVILEKKIALVRSLDALSIDQIYHLIRGPIPESFPTLQEFEAGLPNHIVQKSKENFARLLEGDRVGGIALPEHMSNNPAPKKSFCSIM